MDFQKFTDDYRRWRWIPRSSSEAFRDAEYAAAIQIYTPRTNWRVAVAEVGTWVAAIVGGGVILYGVVRGVL